MISAKKNFRITERAESAAPLRLPESVPQFRLLRAKRHSVDFKNPQLFGKITSDVATASLTGEPLMNLMLRLSW